MKLTTDPEPTATETRRVAAPTLMRVAAVAAAVFACGLTGPVLALETPSSMTLAPGQAILSDGLLALDGAGPRAVPAANFPDIGPSLGLQASLSPAAPQAAFHPGLYADDSWPATFSEWLETALRVIAALVAVTLIGGLRRR